MGNLWYLKILFLFNFSCYNNSKNCSQYNKVLHCPLYRCMRHSRLEDISNTLDLDSESWDFSVLVGGDWLSSVLRSSAKWILSSALQTRMLFCMATGQAVALEENHVSCICFYSCKRCGLFRDGPGMPLLRDRHALSPTLILVETSSLLQTVWLLWKSPHQHANNRAEHVDIQLLLSLPICFNWSHTAFPSLFAWCWFSSVWDQLAL